MPDTGKRAKRAGACAGSRQARWEVKFTALQHHVSIDLLRESYYSLKKGGGSGSGWDDVERRKKRGVGKPETFNFFGFHLHLWTDYQTGNSQ